jgi:hypothetical protein
MYSLIVLQPLEHSDGRVFIPGHDCFALSRLEVTALVNEYPDHFEGRDEITKELIKQIRGEQ